MPPRLPIQAKSPFHLDPRPLTEMASSRAGLLATSRAFRSLKLRNRGFSEAQFIESLLLLQTAGGDCPEDIQLLHSDSCLERGLGFSLPKVSAIRSFLDRFHDHEVAALRPSRQEQKSFILPSTNAVRALQEVQAGLVARVARLYEQQNRALHVATVDQDATIIESHKRSALPHYEGGARVPAHGGPLGRGRPGPCRRVP